VTKTTAATAAARCRPRSRILLCLVRFARLFSSSSSFSFFVFLARKYESKQSGAGVARNFENFPLPSDEG
jgi:hypothetical protein